MLTRATAETRAALIQAQTYARSFSHPYIGTEHLCMGLLDVDERLATLASECGANKDEIVTELERFADAVDRTPVYVPFTESAKRAIAEAEAQDNNADVVPTILFQALLDNDTSGAVGLLSNAGVDVLTFEAALRAADKRPQSLAHAVGALEDRVARAEAGETQWHERCVQAETYAQQLAEAIRLHRDRAGEHVSPIDLQLYALLEEGSLQPELFKST
jgi:ATP-dependent Clp protease ATP-binding subunit ClpA